MKVLYKNSRIDSKIQSSLTGLKNCRNPPSEDLEAIEKEREHSQFRVIIRWMFPYEDLLLFIHYSVKSSPAEKGCFVDVSSKYGWLGVALAAHPS